MFKLEVRLKNYVNKIYIEFSDKENLVTFLNDNKNLIERFYLHTKSASDKYWSIILCWYKFYEYEKEIKDYDLFKVVSARSFCTRSDIDRIGDEK